MTAKDARPAARVSDEAPAIGREGEFTCARSGKRTPEGRCPEPGVYCKHRTACPIRLLEKEASRAGAHRTDF